MSTSPRARDDLAAGAREGAGGAAVRPAPVLRLRDEKGKIYIVPTATIAFVEVGSEESRRVGFVA